MAKTVTSTDTEFLNGILAKVAPAAEPASSVQVTFLQGLLAQLEAAGETILATIIAGLLAKLNPAAESGRMNHKEALQQVLAIVQTVPPAQMGERNEDIYLVLEQLADPDVKYFPPIDLAR